MTSYFDAAAAGLEPDSSWKVHHTAGRAAVTDVVSGGIPAAATEVKHHPFDTASSVIMLLHDKIDSQSKVTIALSCLCLSHVAVPIFHFRYQDNLYNHGAVLSKLSGVSLIFSVLCRL